MTERLMITRDSYHKQFDECQHVVVSRHELHALIRSLSDTVQYLEDDLIVRAYQGVEKAYDMVATISRECDRALDVVEEQDE